jgi:hypothetical protein
MANEQRTVERPLLEDDLTRINEGLEASAKLDAALAKARQAGIDVGNAVAENRDKRTRLLALKNTYFPGR